MCRPKALAGEAARPFSRAPFPPLLRKLDLRTSSKFRCTDDLLVCCHSQAQAQQVKEQLTAWLTPRGHSFNEDKTTIVALERGFDFLGSTSAVINAASC
ncbi:hypothetical protein ACFPIJ_00400 [Dactylosporangium cerinum]|uniref:Reverse transcriptase domain-containing protein n=1 Tax=Dactylosporangium cerinum TaxID=1434730 RepID=A0ABV9VJZ8_9ACTN